MEDFNIINEAELFHFKWLKSNLRENSYKEFICMLITL